MFKYELSYQPAGKTYLMRELYDDITDAISAAEKLEEAKTILYDAWEITPCLVSYIQTDIIWREDRNA